jgi:hypothetical protein
MLKFIFFKKRPQFKHPDPATQLKADSDAQLFFSNSKTHDRPNCIFLRKSLIFSAFSVPIEAALLVLLAASIGTEKAENINDFLSVMVLLPG